MSNPIRKSVFICGLFFLALGVRFLTWQDNHRTIGEVQSSVAEGYKDSACQLAAGNFKTFVSDLNHMGHPPGYPILLAGIFKTFGESDTAIEVFQVLADSVAVVLLFLIAAELLPLGAAVICGVLAAISPQFAYFSVLLLPDSLVVPPILLALFVFIRGRNKPRINTNFAVAGLLIGLSCWLRANAFLLAPFMAMATPLFVARGKRLHAMGAIVAGAVVAIAPITIKNAITFHRFVPLSLGAGQTMLEGLADYDQTNRFNIPNTDLGLMRQEAEWYGKPEYAQLLFGRDGIERDRMRLARAWSLIRSHPLWFAGVVLKRAVASTRLDPAPLLKAETPVSHNVSSFSDNATSFRVDGNGDKYVDFYVSATMNVDPGRDYALQVPLKLEAGRIQLKITDERQERVLESTNVDLMEGVPASEQPLHNLAIPFVSGSHSQVRFVISNFAAESSSALLGTTHLVELGPSSYQWLRYVRLPLGFTQRFFKTAWILPLLVVGLILLVPTREWQSLALLLAVPAYYLIVQSMLHTERRYVYVIHFFFLIAVSLTLWRLATLIYNFATGFCATHKPETPKGRFV